MVTNENKNKKKNTKLFNDGVHEFLGGFYRFSFVNLIAFTFVICLTVEVNDNNYTSIRSFGRLHVVLYV